MYRPLQLKNLFADMPIFGDFVRVALITLRHSGY